MKRICTCLFILVLLCCVFLLPTEAAAAEMTEGPYTYEVTDGKVTITDCKATTAGSLSIPETLGGYPVTAIGDSAFFACEKLTAVTIPDGVTCIDRFAFYGCSAMKTITIPSSVVTVGESAFARCSALTYNVYENIKYIGNSQSPYHIMISAGQITADSCMIHPDTRILYDRAFYNCTSLTSVTIPAEVTVIGWEVFSGCTGLRTITIPNKVVSIGYQAFYQCTALTAVTLPDSVTSLGKEAFAGCADAVFQSYGGAKYLGNEKNPYYAVVGSYDSTISSVSIHSATKLIADGAFSVHESLTDVHIPDGVTIIGEAAFYWSGLQVATIPNSVTTIGMSAFYGCHSLTSVSLPNNITAIADYTFHNCHSLASVVIPDSVKTIGAQAFFACENLTSVTFGKGVTTIGESAFHSTKLTVVNIPANVTAIGQNAFCCYDNLTKFCVDESNPAFSNDDWGVLFNKDKTTLIRAPGAISGSYTIPKSVTTLAESAFSECKNLTTVTLLKSITAISYGAFYDCTSLTSVVIPDSVKSVGDYGFQFCKKLNDVYYTGTEGQWKNLLYATGLYNTPLQNATIHYNHVFQTNSLAVYTNRINLRIAMRDKITLQARVLDEHGYYADPSGITFQITDRTLVDIEATGFENDCFYIQLSGLNPGTTTVTFSDTKNGYVVAVPITVFDNSHPAYTLNNIPEISDLELTANFANFNGLYINNCDYQLKDDKSVRLTFDAYNTNYTYGLVEVYDENGELYNIALIDKKVKYTTGIKEVYIDGGACFVQACFDQTLFDYRSGFFSKHTPVEVDIPRNGYIKITCDPDESDIVALVNYSHLLVSALSLAGEVKNFDPADTVFPEALTKNLLKTTAYAQFKKDGSKFYTNLITDELKDLTITPTTVGGFADTLSQRLIDFQAMDLLKKSMADSGIGFAEDVFTKMLGMYGAALKTIFVIGKCENLVLSHIDSVYTAGGGSITIQNQGGGMRAATQIKLESGVDFAPDVALQAYSVELDEAFLAFVQQADQETYDILTKSICHTYNISLLKGDEKVQHSDYVTVYIPIPEDLRVLSLAGNVKVYRIEEDGSLTDMDAIVEDGCMRFVTNHFSLYTLVGKAEIRGDIDGNGVVEREDVVQLLLHISMPSLFPIEAHADFDNNGVVERADVLQLLLHISMPDMFPL